MRLPVVHGEDEGLGEAEADDEREGDTLVVRVDDPQELGVEHAEREPEAHNEALLLPEGLAVGERLRVGLPERVTETDAVVLRLRTAVNDELSDGVCV